MSLHIMIAEDQAMVRQALVALPETDVLSAAAGHESVAVIAARLHLSAGTVRNHLSAAIQKLGARNRADAAQIAREKGWL